MNLYHATNGKFGKAALHAYAWAPNDTMAHQMLVNWAETVEDMSVQDVQLTVLLSDNERPFLITVRALADHSPFLITVLRSDNDSPFLTKPGNAPGFGPIMQRG